MTKICAKCKESKKLIEFSDRKYKTSIGKHSYCKQCFSTTYKDRYKERVNNYNKSESYKKSRRKYRRALSGTIQGMLEKCLLKTKDTDITKEWIISKVLRGRCELTNIVFSNEDFGLVRRPLKPSIDRIDSSKGYYKNNCRIILCWLNIAKQDMPEEMFLKELLKVAECIKLRHGLTT